MLAVLLLHRMRARQNSLRTSLRKKQWKPTKKQEEIQVSENTEQLVEYCRTCLISTNLLNIFYSEDTAKKRSEDLKTVTGLEIAFNDGLSQKMCVKCMETLNLALQFRIISVKNDQKLRKALQNLNENPQYDFRQEYEDEYKNVENEIEDQEIEFIEDEFYFDQDCFETDVNNINNQQQHLNDLIEVPDIIYKCHVCGKEYYKKRTFKKHVKSHSYSTVCEDCGKLCSSRSQLLEHKRAAHRLRRVHLCDQCDYSSASKAGLVVHSRRHSGSREYTCEHCGASFRSRGGLVQHLPIHNDVAEFECDICHKKEKSKRLLNHHYHKVHREKTLRYLCPVCQSVFKSITGVRLHLIKSHDVPREDQPAIQRFKVVPDSDGG